MLCTESMLALMSGWAGVVHVRLRPSSATRAVLAGSREPNMQVALPNGAKPVPDTVTIVPPATGPPSGKTELITSDIGA